MNSQVARHALSENLAYRGMPDMARTSSSVATPSLAANPAANPQTIQQIDQRLSNNKQNTASALPQQIAHINNQANASELDAATIAHRTETLKSNYVAGILNQLPQSAVATIGKMDNIQQQNYLATVQAAQQLVNGMNLA